MGKRRRVIDVDVYEEDNGNQLYSRKVDDNKGNERSRRHNKDEERASKKKSRRDDYEENVERDGSSNFDFNNLDFGQIASMLQNTDLNQISSLLGGLGNSKDGSQGILEGLGALGGLGASDSGQGLLGGLGSLLGSGGLQGILGSLGGLGGLAGMLNNGPSDSREDGVYKDLTFRGDRGVEILWALRPLVTPERASLIEMVVQLYAIGKILKGTFY